MPLLSDQHALQHYLEKIDEIDQIHNKAVQQGENPSTNLRTFNENDNELGDDEPDEPRGGGEKCEASTNENTDKVQGVQDDRVNKDGEGTSKKRTSDKSLFPWIKSSDATHTIDLCLRLTLDLKRN